MYRSWAYILMIMATLAGVVGLLWPSPPIRTIEEIAMPARGAGKGPKAARPAARNPAKPPRPKPAPAVVRRMPSHTTSSRRGAAVPQNGMQPNHFARPSTRTSPSRSRPSTAQARKPAPPPRPGAAPPPPGTPKPPPAVIPGSRLNPTNQRQGAAAGR